MIVEVRMSSFVKIKQMEIQVPFFSVPFIVGGAALEDASCNARTHVCIMNSLAGSYYSLLLLLLICCSLLLKEGRECSYDARKVLLVCILAIGEMCSVKLFLHVIGKGSRSR